jgi:hypothetical protein
MWKEYRVQRGLWLAMAVGCFILQGLIAFLMPSGPERFQGIVPIAFMLTGFYAIGSGAITFAIEREEGTQLRPVMLGCPPGLTLTVKTLFGIISTTLLLAVTIASGMLLSLGSLALLPNTFHPEAARMIVPLTLLFVALPYFGGLLWSMFFSLLTRKVIVALGMSAVAMIVSYAVVVAYGVEVADTPDTRRYGNPITGMQVFLVSLVPCLLAASLLVVNYLLTYRWLTRAFFDQTSSRSPSFFKRWRIRRSGFDGGMVVEIGVEDRTAFEVVSAEVAVSQPPPRFGLSWLYALWGPNLWRHLRFLRWKEAIETRKVYVGFLLATLGFTFWIVSEHPLRTDWHGPVGFLIHAVCLACGAMAFRAEQDERKVQRLADMGLKPETVWLSKHLVWLVRAVLGVSAIFLFVILAGLFSRNAEPLRYIGSFSDNVWLNLQLPNSLPSFDPGLRLIGRAIILTLTMYGIGQVCSQLIRSTIVSLFVSFILALTAFGWASVCWYFGVPFILSVLPLAIGCLLVTYFRTKSWMIDDNRGRAWAWPAASIIAACAIIYTGTGLFRVYQIPWAEPFFGDSAETHGNDGLTDEQRAAVLAPVTGEERSTFALFQRTSELLGKNRLDDRFGTKTVEELWRALSEDDQLAAEKAIRLLLEAAELPACADFSPATTNVSDVAASTSGQAFQDSVGSLLFDARREIESGNVNVALDRYRTAFAVSRHAAGRGAEMNWWLSHQLTQKTLRAIQEWAKHPGVDATLSHDAAEIIDDHRRQMTPIEVTNFATAVMVRNTLDADAFTIAELTGDSSNRLPVLLATKFPGERPRSLRLLNALESHDVEILASYRAQLAAAKTGIGQGLTQWYNSAQSKNAALRDQTRFLTHITPLLAMITSVPADYICLSDIKTEHEIRATKLLLRLLQQQRIGELPETLDDFDASLNDPWTDKPFIWYPEGLPADLKQINAVIVSANTPFFLSTGYSQATIRRVEYGNAEEGFGAFAPEQMEGGEFSGLGFGSSGSSLSGGDGEPRLGGQPSPGPDGNSRPASAVAAHQGNEESIHVEYVLEGGTHHSSDGVAAVWLLPRKASTGGKESE